jgi:phosphoenolpyruvate synthase/pyruvate phosphate dikinase
MKSPYVLPLSDSQATLDTVGGKGMSLAKMIQAGFPVPDGFHIPMQACRRFGTTACLPTGMPENYVKIFWRERIFP